MRTKSVENLWPTQITAKHFGKKITNLKLRITDSENFWEMDQTHFQLKFGRKYYFLSLIVALGALFSGMQKYFLGVLATSSTHTDDIRIRFTPIFFFYKS